MRAPSDPQIVHPFPADQIDGWVRTMSATFLEEAGDDAHQRWVQSLTRDWDPGRAWGVIDRGRCVATLRTLPRTITVPGAGATTRLLPVDALTQVTVAATHRRRGLLSRMLGESLAAARERGDALSILIAAEWPIYGRFGYGPAVLETNLTLYPRRAGGRVTSAEPGRVRQVEREEFGTIAPDVFAAARRLRAGQVDRDQPWWDRELGLGGYPKNTALPYNWLVHEGDDGPDGLLAWSATRGFGSLPPMGAVRALGPFAANDVAYRNLWSYLSGLDAVDEIALPNRPADEAIRWLLGDGRTLVLTEQSDSMWLRLLDVPAALEARGYAVSGELVLEVVDDGAPSVAGRYRLSVDGDAVQCEPTGDDPDLTVTQPALASVYLGGMGGLRPRLLEGAVAEHTPGALSRADAMLVTPLVPWNATDF